MLQIEFDILIVWKDYSVYIFWLYFQWNVCILIVKLNINMVELSVGEVEVKTSPLFRRKTPPYFNVIGRFLLLFHLCQNWWPCHCLPSSNYSHLSDLLKTICHEALSCEVTVSPSLEELHGLTAAKMGKEGVYTHARDATSIKIILLLQQDYPNFWWLSIWNILCPMCPYKNISNPYNSYLDMYVNVWYIKAQNYTFYLYFGCCEHM